ncbi:MAG: helix-turn-helix transcriptional regulator [Marinoscillum sp.]
MKLTANQIISTLSPREIEILKKILNGNKRDEISTQLGISKLTYDGYRKNIRNKLNIRNQADWLKVLNSVSNEQDFMK